MCRAPENQHGREKHQQADKGWDCSSAEWGTPRSEGKEDTLRPASNQRANKTRDTRRVGVAVYAGPEEMKSKGGTNQLEGPAGTNDGNVHEECGKHNPFPQRQINRLKMIIKQN